MPARQPPAGESPSYPNTSPAALPLFEQRFHGRGSSFQPRAGPFQPPCGERPFGELDQPPLGELAEVRRHAPSRNGGDEPGDGHTTVQPRVRDVRGRIDRLRAAIAKRG